MKLKQAWLSVTLTALTTYGVHALANANEAVVKPFHYSALTETQISAWNSYIKQESGLFGCHYGDDPRLVENPRALLSDLATGKQIEPVRITLRSYLNAADTVQKILQKNMYIASMECNKVYLFGDEFIGHPVLPFEEYMDIFVSKLRQDQDLRKHLSFLRGTKIAAMDARWFWNYFILDAEHHQLIGHAPNTIMGIAGMLPGEYQDITPENAYELIYQRLVNQGFYIEQTNQCKGEVTEPNDDVLVGKNITGEQVVAFYHRNGLNTKGGWKPKVERNAQGYTLAVTRPVNNPTNPFFNVTRGLTVFPEECK